MKKLQNYLLLTMLLFGHAVAALAASSYSEVYNSTRSDFRDESIYFIITTRFFDGDESNNVQCWSNQSANAGDPPWRGDFKGLIDRLDYIKALGFTTVWITPIVENASGYDYHGYHAINFDKVDKRYESQGIGFQEVINAAHAKGMKIILDIVLNHSGNFGEENLFKFFERDYNGDWTSPNHLKPLTVKDGGILPDNYLSMDGDRQFNTRIVYMKNTDAQNHDSKNIYHHVGNNWGWDDYSRWYGQIAGDCVDLNTENPLVSNYLVKCYGKFIKMGVDGFRIDTSGHISRLTFNKAFIPQFAKIAEENIAKRNGGPFFMFGEVCARGRQVTYRSHENCSPYFYTWAETKNYSWTEDENSWNNLFIKEGEFGDHVNMNSTKQQGKDYDDESGMLTSSNHALNGNNYRTPDYSKASGFSVIDFPMHWNFENAHSAWSIKDGDNLYNDATYNVVYVDSHDYAPDGQSTVRFAGDQATWAENASLMFTFRGIPCIYYGSEIEFKKGVVIDQGPNGPLSNTGRAYYGGYITGDINVTDFAAYSATGNANATLKHPLALHFQRLNQIRMAVPALRKGQYSTQNCNASYGSIAFKRRYTDKNTDSFVLVTISGSATFTGLPGGKYVDVVTGDVKQVSEGGSLTANCSGKGNLRAYVLQTKGAISGKVGNDGKYLYGSSPVSPSQPAYDGKQEATSGNNGGGTVVPSEPEVTVDPCVAKGEYAIFFQKPSEWSKSIYCYIWKDGTTIPAVGEWPGAPMTYLGNGNYKLTLNHDLTGYNFIFNAGGDNQKTKDVKDLKMSAMYNVNGDVVKTVAEGDCEAGEGTGDNPEQGGGNNDNPTVTPSISAGEQCVFFQAPANWSSNVNCYVWYGAGNNDENRICGQWPGKPCESLGGGIYKYCFDRTIGEPEKWNVIFTDGIGGQEGVNQTADLPCTNATLYKLDGSTSVVGIEDIYAMGVDVYAYNRTIYVANAEGRTITVRSLDGCVIYSGTNQQIAVQSAGIYLVTVDAATLKVMVK